MKKLITDNKGIVLISVGLLLLLIGWFYYSQSFEKDINTQNPFENINTSVDLEKGKDLQENKIDAYKDEIKDSITLANSKKGGNLDMDTDIPQKKEDRIQRKVDSILNLNQVQYNLNSNPAPQRRVSVSTNEPRKEVKIAEDKSMTNFFSNQPAETSEKNNMGLTDEFIYASINEDQVVLKNGRVELRLNKDALISGKKYAKNTFLYGTALFGTNRLFLEITNINHVPVALKAYDAQDGNLGIYTDAESLRSETVNDASAEIVRDINVVGIPVGQTVKKIFQRKAQEQKVTLLNNYKLILKSK